MSKLNKKMRTGLATLGSTNVADLKTAAVAVASADVSALGTVTHTAVSATASSATAVADAVGDVGAGALANDLKAKYNVAVTEIADLRARDAQDDVAVASLATTVNELRTLANELKANFNALQAAIDALT